MAKSYTRRLLRAFAKRMNMVPRIVATAVVLGASSTLDAADIKALWPADDAGESMVKWSHVFDG